MSKRSAVQNPMLQYADQIGWDYVNPEDAMRLRGGDTSLYFREALEAQLLRLNPGVVDVGRAADIIRRLNLLNPTIEGNRDALSWLQGEQSVFVPEEKRERNVYLIDFDHLENNVFHVTDEWRQKGTVFANRADVVFLINGIPVAVAETKSASKRDGLSEGVDQMRRYHTCPLKLLPLHDHDVWARRWPPCVQGAGVSSRVIDRRRKADGARWGLSRSA